ncbi:MAG: restriction endonuclease [Thiofilum sp.]|nr:restriction endonuclease [Thiofilum sp.]
MDVSYHYPPEVFSLLVDTIPLLCKSKQDVILFLKGSGVSNSDLHDLEHRVKTDRQNINKYEIVRTCLQRINQKGDSEIRTRRELIKRVVEIEEFSCCWEGDRLKAKGLVSEIRKIVNIKDTFTKINQERAREKDQQAQASKIQIEKEKEKVRKESIQKIKSDLFYLFSLDNEPHKRGKLLEKVLNDLFKSFEILIKEDFKRAIPNQSTTMEQIDGVIELDGNIYLVEMKWIQEAVGIETIAQHLVRLFNRGDTKAIFIAANGFKETAIAQCREVLSQKTIVLCSLEEIVMLLERSADLKSFLKRKITGTTLYKEPFFKVEI